MSIACIAVTCLSHDSCMQIVQKLLNYILPPPFLTPSPPTSLSPLPPHSHISPHFPASVLGTPPSAALLESSPSVLDRQGHTQCHHRSLHWSTRHNLASEGHVTCHMWGERVSMWGTCHMWAERVSMWGTCHMSHVGWACLGQSGLGTGTCHTMHALTPPVPLLSRCYFRTRLYNNGNRRGAGERD